MADELTPSERGMLEAWRPIEPPADFVDRVVTTSAIRRRLIPVAIAASAVACAAIALVIVLPRSASMSNKSEVASQGSAEMAVVALVAPSDAAMPAVELVAPADAAMPAFIMDAALPMQVTGIADVDMMLVAGENATIHDPQGATLVGVPVAFCAGRGTVEVDQDTRFSSPTTVSGEDIVGVRIKAGVWVYRVRCGDKQGAVRTGRVVVRKDTGLRPLPRDPPVNPIDADGRTYRIVYQALIPNVKIRVPGTASKFKLHLATGGMEETFESDKPAFTIDGDKLKERLYTYWVDLDGVKQAKASTLIIEFDQTAPQVYIDEPKNGAGPWPDELELRGAVLPGWTVSLDGIAVPLDLRTRRFSAKIPRPLRALALRFTHAQWGIHYYLRRP